MKTKEKSVVYLHKGHKTWLAREMKTGNWKSQSALITHLLTLGIKQHEGANR